MGAPSEHANARATTPRAGLSTRTLRWVVLVAVVASAWAIGRLWVALVLAAWFAVVARPLHQRLTRVMGDSARAAGVTSVLLVLLALAPLAVVSVSLAEDAMTLAQKIGDSTGLHDALSTFVSNGSHGDGNGVQRYLEVAQRHGMSAMGTITGVAGAVTSTLIALVVFVYGFYVFLVHGDRVSEWLEQHSPLERGHSRRFGRAFVETGRGLLIAVGLTALLQAAIATSGYVAVGLPHAFVLGLLTLIAALIPSVGAALIWVPVSAALYFTGRTGGAIAMLCVGLFVSVADNFVRPWLSRRARLELPTFLLFVAMLGGILAFGPWGLILGPLVIRLSVEGLKILRETRGGSQPPSFELVGSARLREIHSSQP